MRPPRRHQGRDGVRAHPSPGPIDGDAVTGIAVTIGARIGSLATGSEVLVSSTVKDMVVGSELAFEDRGTHALKGVPDDWHLFAVAGSSEADDAPAV